MLLDVKPGVPCRLKRLPDGGDSLYSDGYAWNGTQIVYPNGGTVPLVSILRSKWEVVQEPRFKVGDRIVAKYEGNETLLAKFCFDSKSDRHFGPTLTVEKVGAWSAEPGTPAVQVVGEDVYRTWIPESACELFKEPTVEEYVKSRGFDIRNAGTSIRRKGGLSYPGIESDIETPFTLETAKLACDLLEKLK